ncbi:hypothetical protein LP420_37820 [Massilia sp. B-10]|nr:hypothetical protein LP420_37820 [Massilia sp. B-10]
MDIGHLHFLVAEGDGHQRKTLCDTLMPPQRDPDHRSAGRPRRAAQLPRIVHTGRPCRHHRHRCCPDWTGSN